MKNQQAMISLLLLLFWTFAVHGQEDTIENEIELAIEFYEKSVNEATEKLTTLLEKKLHQVQKRGQLEQVLKIQQELDAFEESSVLPKSVPTNNFHARIKKAKSTLSDEYKKAIKKYTQNGDIDSAVLKQEELNSFLLGGEKLKQKDEWISLFDGKDVDTWKLAGDSNNGAVWRVENGILVGSSQVGPSALLTSRSDFKDFHLRVDTMLSEGKNGGLFFRWTPDGGGMQVLIGGTNADGFQDTANIRFQPAFRTAGETVIDAPEVRVEKNTWFRMEVICKHNVLEVLIDGNKIVETEKVDWFKPGNIALVCRGGSKVRFKSVEVKPLK